ncbi:acyl-CoA thioesterase [Streptomyces sp. CAU 1734]|uniref:acyl-CoA thioesterase n=1 Tax=Streptomyces sp. CAU 1734 TaxID=3140360 RepID=UPI003261BC56
MTDTRPLHFELRHRVAFAETDLSGCADHVGFLRWQDRCRELFLSQYAPGLLGHQCEEAPTGPLRLFTQQLTCELLAPVAALDEICVRLSSAEPGHSRLDLGFDHIRIGPGGAETLVARGSQRLACLSTEDGTARPAPIPADLVRALGGRTGRGLTLAGRAA